MNSPFVSARTTGGYETNGLTRIASLDNCGGRPLSDASDEETGRRIAHKLTKVQSFGVGPSRSSVQAQSIGTEKNGHSQVGEYSHSGLLRPVGVEEAIGVPFVSVWPPNLRQAARSHESCVRDIRDLKKKADRL